VVSVIVAVIFVGPAISNQIVRFWRAKRKVRTRLDMISLAIEIGFGCVRFSAER
jgi:hypothetical protein